MKRGGYLAKAAVALDQSKGGPAVDLIEPLADFRKAANAPACGSPFVASPATAVHRPVPAGDERRTHVGDQEDFRDPLHEHQGWRISAEGHRQSRAGGRAARRQRSQGGSQALARGPSPRMGWGYRRAQLRIEGSETEAMRHEEDGDATPL
ncbi:hypothetical protein BHE74_00040229 [Ensete ventricosum]|nr:hypothetical protein BHE74_00040229 [Ensete ventricosum]